MKAEAIRLPAALMRGEQLLTIDQVRERVPKSRATIYRWIRDERFPRPRQIGPGSVAWLASEIDDWIFQKVQVPA